MPPFGGMGFPRDLPPGSSDAVSPAATLPLHGITVVSVEHAVAAPYATRQLADLGARVIKIERPGDGDFARSYDETVLGQSSYFVWLNRSKESVVLDLKAEGASDIVDRLLDRADVFVQNLAPGAAARLGLDAAALQQRFPRLIACEISGYGATGPWSGRKAYDMLVQSEAGLVSLTGPESEPSRVGISIADIAAGMFAYSGILTALFRRATTGAASAVRVSLLEALAEWMGAPAYYTAYGGTEPTRVGARHSTIAPYGVYRTAEGSTVVLAVQSQAEWAVFCRSVLDDPELAADPRFHCNSARVANRDALDGVIASRFRELRHDAAVELLDRSSIANAQVRSMKEFLEHPSLHGRDRWHSLDTPAGAVTALRPPVDIAGVPCRMDPVPALGQHTEAILTELGVDLGTVEQLRASGAI